MEVQKLRQTFHEIDSDHTGTISFVEMAEACKRLNIQVDIDKLIQSMDEDGDGVINYDEFITATADRQLVHHQNNIWWAFCEYDTNGVRREARSGSGVQLARAYLSLCVTGARTATLRWTSCALPSVTTRR